jgi:hypothetical protein
MCHSADFSVSDVIEVWEDAAIQLLGDEAGVLHLNADQYEAIREALAAHGHRLGGTPFVREGRWLRLPDYWPTGEDFFVEAKVTPGLYLAITAALRCRWGDEVGGELRLGGFAAANGVEGLWLEEERRRGEGLGYGPARDRVIRKAQAMRRGVEARRRRDEVSRRRPAGGGGTRITYHIAIDSRTGRVSAHFPTLEISSERIRITDNDKAIRGLMVEASRVKTPTLRYDQLAGVLTPGVIPSKLSDDERVRPCEAIRTAVSRFNRKVRAAAAACLAGRLDERHRAAIRLPDDVTMPLVSQRGGGVWELAVEVREYRGE